jgi:hypothetical protein
MANHLASCCLTLAFALFSVETRRFSHCAVTLEAFAFSLEAFPLENAYGEGQ